MKKTRIAINGFGRIGRVFFRYAFGHPDLEFVAINDLGAPENMAYLLKYDTVYGPYDKSVETKNGNLIVDGKEIKVLQEKDILKLPWKDLNIDVVIESTGVFESRDKAAPHLDAGAKRVVITAPAKGDVQTVLVGVNDDLFKKELIASNLNWIAIDSLEDSMEVDIKIRSTAKSAKGKISPIDNSRVQVIFNTPQRAITRGQSVVFYKEDSVMGGGIITK